MYYILFDLEAIGTQHNNDFMEIVEIAAYKIKIMDNLYCDSEYMKQAFIPQSIIVDSFHEYIKPVFHSTITKKIDKLINIDMNKLQTGKAYEDAIMDFVKWAGGDSIFVSWSNSDEEMISENNNKHFIYNFPGVNFMDLQKVYDSSFMKNKRTGLELAIKELGLKFSGNTHNAVDDSYNMIPIFTQLIKINNINTFYS